MSHMTQMSHARERLDADSAYPTAGALESLRKGRSVKDQGSIWVNAVQDAAAAEGIATRIYIEWANGISYHVCEPIATSNKDLLKQREEEILAAFRANPGKVKIIHATEKAD